MKTQTNNTAGSHWLMTKGLKSPMDVGEVYGMHWMIHAPMVNPESKTHPFFRVFQGDLEGIEELLYRAPDERAQEVLKRIKALQEGCP